MLGNVARQLLALLTRIVSDLRKKEGGQAAEGEIGQTLTLLGTPTGELSAAAGAGPPPGSRLPTAQGQASIESLRRTNPSLSGWRPRLRGAQLGGSNLSGTNLRHADLREANLAEADLRSADLEGASMSSANLRQAVLTRARLVNADLTLANLREADLRGADLNRARLAGADLTDADLRGAYLQEAVLRDACLNGADLRGADLRGARLDNVEMRGAIIEGALLSLPVGADFQPADSAPSEGDAPVRPDLPPPRPAWRLLWSPLDESQPIFAIALEPGGESTIGRSTPREGLSRRDIDLAGFGSLAARVSRQHARLAASVSALTLGDLRSKNGTFVNTLRLFPGQMHVVSDGDVVQFGRLSFVITILGQPEGDV